MERQRRVIFSFGRDSDVRYLAELPDVGDYVTHGKELWLVSTVEDDVQDTVVVCEPPLQPGPLHGMP